MPHPRTATWSAHTHLRGGGGGGISCQVEFAVVLAAKSGNFAEAPGVCAVYLADTAGNVAVCGALRARWSRATGANFAEDPGFCVGNFAANPKSEISHTNLTAHNPPPPPCVAFRLVVVSLQGPGQSPVLPFACCVGSLRSVGRCGRCSCWCRFRVRGAQRLVCRGCAGCGMVSPLPRWLGKPEPQDTRTHTIDVTNGQQPRQQAAIKEAGLH